jgi:CheY-like chemotaxis protein
MRVMIADDDKRARDWAVGVLSSEGHEVCTATSGYDAIRVADRERPDVIVLDGLMPEMHGFEVARFIRLLDKNYAPRMVTLTAVYKGVKYYNEAKLRYGIDAYVEKPASPEQLLNAVAPGEYRPHAVAV